VTSAELPSVVGAYEPARARVRCDAAGGTVAAAKLCVARSTRRSTVTRASIGAPESAAGA
jgi:hypothetical protein